MVVVKPKRDSQWRDDTMEREKECLDFERLVHDTQSTRDSYFVISCMNAIDTITVQNMIHDKIGNDFDVSLTY